MSRKYLIEQLHHDSHQLIQEHLTYSLLILPTDWVADSTLLFPSKNACNADGESRDRICTFSINLVDVCRKDLDLRCIHDWWGQSLNAVVGNEKKLRIARQTIKLLRILSIFSKSGGEDLFVVVRQLTKRKILSLTANMKASKMLSDRQEI